MRITLACGDYDRMRPLRDGRVALEGLSIEYLPLESEELFFRQLRYHEFEVSELSLCNYAMLQARGNNPFVAIPVFPSRHFRHGFVWVHRDAGIDRPEDLTGKRVGVPEYHVTAALWTRGFLEDDYGVRPEDVEWHVAGLNHPGRHSRLDLVYPSGVRVVERDPGATLNDLLVRGEIDALIAPRYPNAFIAKDPRVRRLFPNFGQVEREYFQRTKIFPIMHTIVIQRDLYEAHPWMASTLYRALSESKRLCQERLASGFGVLPVMLPWLLEHIEEAETVYGQDYWAYGIEPNRHVLETMIRYLERQGLVSRHLSVEELFAPNTEVEAPPS